MRCAEVRSPFPGYTSAVGELAVRGARSLTREWIGDSGCLTGVAALGRTRPEGEPDVVEPSRHWDGAGLERKIRSAGRQWTVGDIAMVADGQWAVCTKPEEDELDAVARRRIADGRGVEMTVEELARAVGSPFGQAHRDEAAG